MKRAAGLSLGLALLLPPQEPLPAEEARPLATVTLEGELLAGQPITLSQIGADGDFDRGIAPVVEGRQLPAQVDVLRHAGDGSIRHALVTFVLPALESPGEVRVGYVNEPAESPAPFVFGFDPAELDLKLVLEPAGLPPIESTPEACEGEWRDGDGLRVLHDGPLMKEIEIHEALPLASERKRTVLDVFWRLRAHSGDPRVRVSVVVENSRPWGEDVRPWKPFWDFDGLELRSGERVLHEEPAYQHLDRTRFRIVASSGEPLPGLRAHPDVDYLERGRFFPPYRPVGNPTAAGLERRYLEGRRPGSFRILRSGVIHEHMPGTGGRPDVGGYPAWAFGYLQSRSSRLYRAVLHADGNGGGAFPIHIRLAPGVSGYQVAKLPPTPRRARVLPHRRETVAQTEPDHAHTPSIGYLGYILTGDAYYAEEMAFWASYQSEGLSLDAPERMQAWCLRHLVDAAFLLPDAHPLREHFTRRVDWYLAAFDRRYVQSGRPVHFFREKWNGSGQKYWVNCRQTMPWQAAWHVWSLGNAFDKGFEAAAGPRQWTAEFLVGLYTSKDEFVGPDGQTYRFDPRDAVTTRLATTLLKTRIGERNGNLESLSVAPLRELGNYGEIWYYTKLNEDNSYYPRLTTRPDADGNWPLKEPGWGHGRMADGGRMYNYHRYGSLPGLVSAVNGGVEGAEEAWEVMSGFLAPKGSNLYGYDMRARAHVGLE